MKSLVPVRAKRGLRVSARASACAVFLTFGSALSAQSTTSTVPPRMPMAASDGMALMMRGPLDLPMSRTGSGTSWLPDSAPMFGVMRSVGSWGIMAHASVFAQANAQGGARGETQLGSLNWAMAGATHALAGGRLQLRGMVSADALTVGGKGYPLLLQTGETYRGEAIHDRQHPHDVFMEIAAVYDRAIARNLAFQLYAAAAGEPASGPVAFPHRPSAAADPFATLAHHWQDATHVSFGVLTGALYSRRVKLEASLFNGREPDDVRTNLDYRGARLDAIAGRVTVNATPFSSFSASYANMPDAEVKHPGEAVQRATASWLHSRPRAENGSLSVALIAGANAVEREHWTSSVSAELLRDFRGRTTVFARGELVQKSEEELALPSESHAGSPKDDEHEETFRIASMTVGVVRELLTGKRGMLGLGVRGTVNLVPSTIQNVYGSRTPVGGAIYLRWRPSRMNIGGMQDDHSMHGAHNP